MSTSSTVDEPQFSDDDKEEEDEEQDLREEITKLFGNATFLELNIRQLNDEDEEEREEKAELSVRLSSTIEALSQFTEVRYGKISSFQPLMDGPAVIDYADSIISWFTSGVRRQCINICKPAAKVLPQHLSTRTFSVTSKTDENVRLQCQKQVTQLESDWNDIQRMTRARATRSREIKMREKLTSLLESRNEVRKEIGDLKASLRNIIPDPNSMDVDTSSISFPLDNSQISSLAGYIARNQVSPLLQNLAEDCKAGLSASTKILYEGVWEKLAMPLAVAAVACDTLPQECMPKQ